MCHYKAGPAAIDTQTRAKCFTRWCSYTFKVWWIFIITTANFLWSPMVTEGP